MYVKEMIRHHQLRHRCSWNTVSNSPTHQAAFNNDYRKLNELLVIPENQKKINLLNHLKCTPLRLAATKGSHSCIRLLINQGAKVDVADLKGQTALFVAVKNNHPSCVRLLLQHGADPNGDPSCLSVPLYIAAMQGHTECLQLLIQANANVNSRLTKDPSPCSTNTPLRVSFTYRHRRCFRMLLQAGADPNCGLSPKETEKNMTLLDAAIQWGDVYFVKLLVEFGGTMVTNCAAQTVIADRQRNKELENYLRLIKYVPSSLQSQCRLVIRRYLGAQRLASIGTLSLPIPIKKYLHHDHL